MFQSALREHKVDVDVRVDPNSADWHWDDVVLHFFERTLKKTPDEVSDEALWRRIVEIIIGVLGVDEHQIGYFSSFYDDLEIDSLEAVELQMAFEEEFDLPIPEGDVESLTTVGAVYQYLKEKGCEATSECVTAVANGLTLTASGEAIDKNSPKNKKRKSASATSDKNRPKGKKRTNESPSSEQSKFEYNDKDRFIVRLFERMIEASNHNPIVEKAQSFVKRFFKDDLSDREGFTLTIEADSGVYGGRHRYEFYLDQDELVISEIILGVDLGPWVSGGGAIGNFLWELKSGFHVTPGHDEEGEIEEGVISLLKHGAFIY
jgi:acyl carrier protein